MMDKKMIVFICLGNQRTLIENFKSVVFWICNADYNGMKQMPLHCVIGIGILFGRVYFPHLDL